MRALSLVVHASWYIPRGKLARAHLDFKHVHLSVEMAVDWGFISLSLEVALWPIWLGKGLIIFECTFIIDYRLELVVDLT